MSSTPSSTTTLPLPKSWHTSPTDSFHGKITPSGPFHPEKDRYHLYIGLFCPFAHRANLLLHLKQLSHHAGITTSIVKPYPKGDENGWPGWQFNQASSQNTSDWYAGSTIDHLHNSTYMHELYFLADPSYKGRYSVPVLWDKKLNTIVNNESAELLRDLQTAFNALLPPDLAEMNLYPADLAAEIDRISIWLQRDLNTGVYKTGFAITQESYSQNLPAVFAALNKLEKLLATSSSSGGPYLLGSRPTELDILLYPTLIRFDTVYVQHFKCNLGMIRYTYPRLHNWLKFMYWGDRHEEFRNTTDFRHIKENYTKSHKDINPLGITPVGPWPDVEEGWVEDASGLGVGEMRMREVLEYEGTLG